MNKPEYEVAIHIKNMGLEFEYEKPLVISTGYVRPDFIIESLKLVIECYGDFWHGSPALFKEDSILYTTITRQEKNNNDAKRIQEINLAGYSVITIWESDIKIKILKDWMKLYGKYKIRNSRNDNARISIETWHQ